MSSAPGPPYPPTGNRRRRLRRPHSMPGVVAQSVFVGALFASPSCSEGLLNPGIVVTPPKVQPVVGFFQPNGQLKAFVTAPSFSICSTGGLERRLSSSRVCGLSRYSTRTVLSVITGGDDGGDRGEGVWEPETRSEDAVEDLAGNASGLQQVVMSEDAIGAAADANERPNSHQEEPEVMEGTSTMRQRYVCAFREGKGVNGAWELSEFMLMRTKRLNVLLQRPSPLVQYRQLKRDERAGLSWTSKLPSLHHGAAKKLCAC